MKSLITLIIIIIPLFVNSQSIEENVKSDIKNSKISELYITNAKKIKFVGNDSTVIYGKKLNCKKYYVKCRSSVPLLSTRTSQHGYFKGTFHYEIFVVNDSSLLLRDSLLNDIYNYLKSPRGLSGKNVYANETDFVLFMSSGYNNYGDYLLYWYHNSVYKIVLTKSRVLFWNDQGGLYDIDIQFKTSSNKDFFPFKYDGLEAYQNLLELLH